MSTKYENFQDLENEERRERFKNGLLPPQSFLQHFCSGLRLILLNLGLSLLLLVAICVIGFKNSKFQSDLVSLRTSFSNFTSNTEAEVQALSSQGHSAQGTIESLKSEVENHRQELQAARSLNDKVLALENTLDKQQHQLKADYSEMLSFVQKLAKDLNSLNCKIASLKNNGSQTSCCPTNWLNYEGSCYWFSSSGKSWHEAEKNCQLKNAHLVVINSREEENFVQEYIGSSYTWMGLSDPDGVWKWADGTNYETNYKNWRPGQPDDWHGHGLGGGEDCAHLHPDGGWNDNACQRIFHWVCETGLSLPS
ncbi:C-type lectin domain family 10 member A [Sorex fumeus]|uniref:C-type lectin domain family 10 member A n=1 Tax=Sorex fumeus TaxID=62283 RepID=UPI0024AD3720|nr:C-type lectin domain family 10 member A [Sorex fumeus]